jgi:hypothetical protein
LRNIQQRSGPPEMEGFRDGLKVSQLNQIHH